VELVTGGNKPMSMNELEHDLEAIKGRLAALRSDSDETARQSTQIASELEGLQATLAAVRAAGEKFPVRAEVHQTSAVLAVEAPAAQETIP
jgi:chromosome segregation ATPase